MPKILLAGFETWGEQKENSSWRAVSEAQPSLGEEWQLDKRQLPVSWTNCALTLRESLELSEYKIVLLLGMAQKPMIQIETLARNLADVEAEDGLGHKAMETQIVADGPDTLPFSLPGEALRHELDSSTLPCILSEDAGSYLCNFAFYHLMFHCRNNSQPEMAGFIHVPTFEIENAPSAEALQKVVENALEFLTARF
jgi:pyroglutamyl-peptidase